MRRMRRMRRNSCAGSRSLPFASVAVVFFSFLFFCPCFFILFADWNPSAAVSNPKMEQSHWSSRVRSRNRGTLSMLRTFQSSCGFLFFYCSTDFYFPFFFFYQSEEICFRFCPKCVPEIMERSLFYFPLNQFLSCFRIDLLSQSGKKKLIKNQIIILITFISMNVPETMERSSTFPMLETDSTVFFNQFLSCFRIDLLSQTD